MSDRPTYGNWRKPRSAGIGRLSMGGTVILFIGLIVSMVLLPVNLFVGIGSFGVLAIGLAPLVWQDRWGRTGYQRIVERWSWSAHRRQRGHLYLAGPLSRTPSVTCRLPGLAARVEAFDALDALGRPFVVLHHPKPGHVSTVIECAPPGTALIDDDEVDQWVAGWGAWLSDLGHEPGIAAASVSVETAPDPGVQLRRATERKVVDDAPGFAVATLHEVVSTFPQGAATTTMRIAITWTRSRYGSRRRPVEDVAVEIGARLPELCSSLITTGAGVARAMTRATLASALRGLRPDQPLGVGRGRRGPRMD